MSKLIESGDDDDEDAVSTALESGQAPVPIVPKDKITRKGIPLLRQWMTPVYDDWLFLAAPGIGSQSTVDEFTVYNDWPTLTEGILSV